MTRTPRLVTCLLVCSCLGCPGGGGAPLDTQARPDAVPDRPHYPGTERLPGENAPPPVCAVFAKEGQSCDGGQACPAGYQPARLGGTACTCHLACNPQQGQYCQPRECDRVCVQLMDSGKPLPGVGACVQDKGAAEGEPCVPACKLTLSCVEQSSDTAFCRRSCETQADCPAYKTVCVPITGSTNKVCVPGGATVGPKLGEPCAGPTDFCVQDLICDPASKICVKACTPAGAPCTAPQQCSKLLDAASGVLVGYGCKP